MHSDITCSRAWIPVLSKKRFFMNYGGHKLMSLIKRVNLERKFRFILLILFVTLSNFSLIRITKLTFITEKIGFIQPGMLDFLVNLCKGTTEVKISKDTFYIPVDPGFMGIQFLVLLLVSDISSLKLRGNEHVFFNSKIDMNGGSVVVSL